MMAKALSGLEQRVLAEIVAISGDRVSVLMDDARLRRAGNGEQAQIIVRDRRAFAAFAGGSVAAAAAYIDGWWDTDDLYALMRLAAENVESVNAQMDGGWRQLPRLLSEAMAAARRRVFGRRSAREDIIAHYDLGNDFFELWLDETLAYSCAVFADPAAALDELSAKKNTPTAPPEQYSEQSQTEQPSELTPAQSDAERLQTFAAAGGAHYALGEASRRKLDNICDKLELAASDSLLDLGCGWGAMSFHAAAARQCAVSAVTLSPAQHRFVAAKAAAWGGQVRATQSDYRDFAPAARFSKLSSVEMIEAVGEKHFGVYFRRIRELLRDEGRAVVQAILIPDARYRAARRSADFIRRYIFPGGALPSLAVIDGVAAAAGLRRVAIERIDAHYAPTLLAWRARFVARRARVLALGFDERFCRTWEYYFCYCAGAFAAGAIGVAQLTFAPS